MIKLLKINSTKKRKEWNAVRDARISTEEEFETRKRKRIEEEQDYAKAAQLYGKACDNGHATACYNLALLYEDGEGVEQDDAKVAQISAKVVQIYKKACDDGDAEACGNLAQFYEGDRRREYDPKVLQLYEKACDGGYVEACGWVANKYFRLYHYGNPRGEDREQDYAKALHYWEKACAGGDGWACESLAFAYYDGVGVEKNLLKAKKFLKRACWYHSTNCDKLPKMLWRI